VTDHVNHFVSDNHPHTHLFEISDPPGWVIYRTDTMEQAACSPRVGEHVKAVLSGKAGPDILPEDVRRFVFDESSAPLLDELSETLRPATSTDHLNTLYVMPTLDCQLRCGYCRIIRRQGHQAGFRLSPEVACAAIDRFLGEKPDGVKRTVVLFGGEPLLVPETVFAAIRRVRSGPGGDHAKVMLQTNAIAIDDKTAEFLAAHDVFVMASIDGPEHIHNHHRTLANGKGSYERTVEGYMNARRHGCRVGISSTVTKETADWFESSFADFLDDLRPDEFGLGTHLHPLSDGRSPHQCSPEQAARIFTNAFLAARERGIPFIQMCQKVQPFVIGRRRRYSCAGCAGKVVVAPNGTAGLCEYNAAEGHSFVALEDFSSDTVADFSRWANRSPLETPQCLKCPAIAICGGGCAYDSQMIMGDALKFDPWFCETNVFVAQWMMRDLLVHSRDSLGDRGFHLLTRQERAAILGRIPAEDQEALPPGDCTCEECVCSRKCRAG
jgi:uncharacterized protein